MKLNDDYRYEWLRSNDKEFDSIIKKGALKIVDIKNIPRDAIFVPSKWALRIKSDGTLKSRLCVLGNLMPQDEMDVTCPTPRLSTVRMMMAYAIKKEPGFRHIRYQQCISRSILTWHDLHKTTARTRQTRKSSFVVSQPLWVNFRASFVLEPSVQLDDGKWFCSQRTRSMSVHTMG